MQKESRVQKSLLNARIGLIFFFLTLVITFYSRKVFLDFLGPEFMGLSSTLNSILSVLNLAEFGIGNSIAVFLYGPIAEGNQTKISEIVSVCGYMYRMVGIFILCSGFIISCFFPLWFANISLDYPLVYFAFYSILASVLIGYFINYKNQLLYADQKQYLIQGYFKTGNIIKNVIQIVIAVYYTNLYIWVFLEFLYNIICCYILNYKIKKEYPWLNSSVSQGRKLFKSYRYIFGKCKQIVVYNLKNFVLNKSDELFVFAFVSLKMVAYYGNYIMIVGKLTDIIRIPFDGMLASVGNLVAEGDNKRINRVFWEMLCILYLCASMLVVGIYFYISPVISLWLGEEYVLSPLIVILLCINSFVYITSFVVYFFNNAYGNYHDVWASWAEAILNICITLLTAWKFGIVGILMGKLLSSLIFLVIWKPLLLFRSGFKKPVYAYWKKIFVYLFFSFCYFSTTKIISIYYPISCFSFEDILWNVFACYTPITITFILLFINYAPGGTDLMNRIRYMYQK